MNQKITSCRRLVLQLFVVLVGIVAPQLASAASCAIADMTTGTIVLSNEQASQCSQYLLLSQSDFDHLRNPFGNDPDWSVVMWAAGATLTMWAFGLGAGVIFNLIRRAR